MIDFLLYDNILEEVVDELSKTIIYDFDNEYSLYNTGERLIICKNDPTNLISITNYILFINYNIKRINRYIDFWNEYKEKCISTINTDIECSITCKEKIDLSEYYDFVVYFNKNLASLITKILINLLFK